MPEAVLQPAPVSAKTRRCLAIQSCRRWSCGASQVIADHRTAAFAATSPLAGSRRLAGVPDREPPEDRPPDDVVEDADPAEAPGKRSGRRAVDESNGAESLARQCNPDEAAVAFRVPGEKVVAVRVHADHHSNDLDQRQGSGVHSPDSQQRAWKQDHGGAPYRVVDGCRVEPASILPELAGHAAAGRALATRS